MPDQLFDPPTLLHLRTLDREGRRRAMVYELANQLQAGLDPIDLDDALGNMVLVAAARLYAAIIAWCALPFDDRRLLPLQQIIDPRTLVILTVLRDPGPTGTVALADLRRLYAEGAETITRALTLRALARGTAERPLVQRFAALAWVLIAEDGLPGIAPDAVHGAIEAIVPETGEVIRQARLLLDEPTLQ
jgi:hypothetical protein